MVSRGVVGRGNGGCKLCRRQGPAQIPILPVDPVPRYENQIWRSLFQGGVQLLLERGAVQVGEVGNLQPVQLLQPSGRGSS